MIGAADDGTLVSLDFRVAAEELVVLCRGREDALTLLLPELTGFAPLDVVERTLVARGMLDLAPDGGTRPTVLAEELVRGLCEPSCVEHVTIDELGSGPGSWLVVAHGEDIAVTVSPTEVASIYDVTMSGPYAPVAETDRAQAALETSLRRLEELLTARRDGTLERDPDDQATALVLGAGSYVERIRRTIDGRTLSVEHRVLLDVDDLGVWELLGVPSPVEGDEPDGDAPVAWIRMPDEEEDDR